MSKSNKNKKQNKNTPSQDVLNETAASSSSLSAGNLNASLNTTAPHYSIDLTGDHAHTETRQNPPIVHPNDSKSYKTAFDTSAPIPQVTIDLAGSMNYLPPQHFGGVLEELQSRDKFFQVQLIENELYQKQHSLFKFFMILNLPISVVLVIVFFVGLVSDIVDTPAWVLVLSIVLTVWHAVHCLIEYQAIKRKSFAKAEKALKSFSLFMMVFFISMMAMLITMFWKMEEMASTWRVIIPAIITFAATTGYYFGNISPAVKVYQILKRKTELEESILRESSSIPAL